MSEQSQTILQISAKAPSWGFDLFREIDIALSTAGYKVTTIYLNSAKHDAPQLDYRGKVILFGINHKNPFWRIKVVVKLISLFRQKKFHAVITHHYKPTAITALVERFLPVSRAFMVNHNPGNLRRPGRRKVIHYVFSSRWQFITVSNWVKRDFLTHAPWLKEKRVTTIYNCIDTETVKNNQLGKQEARKQLNLPNDVFVFGNIHRLDKSKGHDYMIRAFAAAFPNATDVHLVIIGGGSRKQLLKDIAEQQAVADRVHLVGLIPNASTLVKAFDCFVIPSLHEGFGLGLLEGMSAAIPVIASDGGALPEVIGDAGILFPAGEEKKLSESMQTVYGMTEEQRENAGNRALQRLQDNFTPQQYHLAFQKLLYTERAE